jgi:hypothetical protein
MSTQPQHVHGTKGFSLKSCGGIRFIERVENETLENSGKLMTPIAVFRIAIFALVLALGIYVITKRRLYRERLIKNMGLE